MRFTCSSAGAAALSALMLVLPFAPRLATANCECGYTVPSADDGSYFFIDAFETDFLHLDKVDAAHGWRPQVYNVTAELARGPYGKRSMIEQVVPNPLANETAWDGVGINGGDPGLQIWVDPADGDGLVPMGEISSVRSDFLYGSFRIGAKVTGVPGTCTAFFFYRNNSNEIDIEFLSKEYNTTTNLVNLINQTPESLQHGFDAAGTPGFRKYDLGFVPYEGYHDYRFDWTPNRITYYVDGEQVWNLTYAVPSAPGHLIVNQWSNGDALWSAGPPAERAALTISYVKAYVNSSDASVVAAYEEKCRQYDSTKVCAVPDQTSLANPSDGGSDGATVFLQPQPTSGIAPVRPWTAAGVLVGVAAVVLSVC